MSEPTPMQMWQRAGEPGTPGSWITYCPLPECAWSHVSQSPAMVTARAFYASTYEAVESILLADEAAIREHLETHTLTEWVLALTKAQERIRELEAASHE